MASVEPEDVAKVRDISARMLDCGPYNELSSLAEIIGFAYTQAKAEGRTGLDDVELVLEAVNQPRSRADRRRWDALRREARETLKALGYPEALVDLLKR